MAKVETVEGNELNLDNISKVQLLDTSIKGVNAGTVILWVFLFFPMAIALVLEGMFGKNYTCAVTNGDEQEVHTFDKANYKLLYMR